MTALYAFANEYLALAERLADLDLDSATVADTIDASGLMDSLAEKAQGIEYVARIAESHNPAIDAEIARLQALKAHRVKVAAGLRAYLLENMTRAGIEKIECPLFRISIQKNPPAVEVFDPMSIPAAYMTDPKPPAPAPDKALIKQAIKDGFEVPGARLSQSTRLAIK
jgi:hypothetical protein